MKISVITICYNTGKYIERAINSVLWQDYNNYEHIVIDGGSNDNTIDILTKYSHITWVSEPDKGQSDAMNKGLGMSTGDIIMFLNADDEYSPGYFSFVVDKFKKNPCIELFIVDLLININGNKILKVPKTTLPEILHYWPARFPLNPVSYSCKRSLQLKISNFPINNHYTMDYWFLLRAFLFGKIKKEDFVGGVFYFNGNNKSSNAEIVKKKLKYERNKFLVEFFFHKPVFSFIIQRLRHKFSKESLVFYYSKLTKF